MNGPAVREGGLDKAQVAASPASHHREAHGARPSSFAPAPAIATGVGPRCVAADAPYERFGVVDRDASGGYPSSPHNRFMPLDL